MVERIFRFNSGNQRENHIGLREYAGQEKILDKRNLNWASKYHACKGVGIYVGAKSPSVKAGRRAVFYGAGQVELGSAGTTGSHPWFHICRSVSPVIDMRRIYGRKTISSL